MTGFSSDQIALLAAPLSREYVKYLDRGGRKVSYVEGWHVIDQANQIFGYDAWSRETVMSECCHAGEYEKPVWENGRRTNRTVRSFRCSYRARVRVRIGDIVREGSGHGHGYADNPGEAHESAEKEAETDAMKRALMTFGNPFGLALYDKEQANVEAPQKPVERIPAAPTPNHADMPPKVRQAQEARDRIKRAINAAVLPGLIDDILKINAADMEMIKEVYEPTWKGLMDLATARQNEMYASA